MEDFETPLKNIIKGIIGDAACNNLSKYQVPEDVRRMCMSINYLTSQLLITMKMEDPDDRRDHVEKVLATNLKLLRDKLNS